MPTMHAANDEWFVWIATKKHDDNLIAHPRKGDRPISVAGPAGGQTEPGRVAVAAGCTCAMRVFMILRAACGKSNFYPAVLIAVNLIVFRANDDCSLGFGARQIDARIVGRHDWYATSYAREPVCITRVAFVTCPENAVAIVVPTIECEETTRTFVKRFGEIVFGLDA